MNSDLKHLIRLQGIDASIQEIRSRIEKFPSISKALDAKLSAATSTLETAKEKIKHNQANRKKFEGEVTANEAKITKYREQMLNVKTNQEYKALQGEIEHTQQGIKKIEDEILNLMMEFETVQAEIKQAESRLKEDQQSVNAERKLLEAENQKDVSAMESYLEERKGIQGSISEYMLTRYEVVRKARGGIGISAARDYLCDVCKVRIRPQVFQEVRKNDQIIECSACQRILYNPENLDHPFEVA